MSCHYSNDDMCELLSVYYVHKTILKVLRYIIYTLRLCL